MPAQLPLIGRRDYLNHGASSDFIDGFRLRPIEVSVIVGGALGVATFSWRLVGESAYIAAPEPSESGPSWMWDLPDPAYASVTFPAAVYVAGQAWSISAAGVVTPEGVTPAGPTATRNDILAAISLGVTSDIVTWCQPRAVPPILSLGEGQIGWAAALGIYRLKSRQGMTPMQAGTGDENLRARALDAELNFKQIGRSDKRPPDLIDSSTSGNGAGIGALPVSRSSRGFEEF